MTVAWWHYSSYYIFKPSQLRLYGIRTMRMVKHLAEARSAVHAVVKSLFILLKSESSVLLYGFNNTLRYNASKYPKL